MNGITAFSEKLEYGIEVYTLYGKIIKLAYFQIIIVLLC